VDDVGKHVARRGLGLRLRGHAGQVVRFFALRPRSQPRRPSVDLFRRIGGRDLVLATLQPGIDEIACDIGDIWISRMVGEYDRHVEFAHERDEFGPAETVVPHLDNVAQRAAIEPVRQQFEKAAEVAGIEFFGGRELPEQGAETIAEFGHAGIQKPFDRVAGLLKHAPVGGKARPFEREDKAGGNLARPFVKRRRRLRAIECAVNLNRGQARAGISEFLGVRQALRIENAAPRLEGPAADTDTD